MADERTEAIQENTEATEFNTRATIAESYEHPNNMRVEVMRAMTVIIAVLATVFIATKNDSFAEQQAGLILSGVVGGYFGLASQRR